MSAVGNMEREVNHVKISTRWIHLFLSLSVVLVFGQVYEFELVKLDDDLYVTDNPHIRDGLTVEGVRWAFTSTEHGYFWQPVLWLSYMIDVEIFGGSAGGFHVTNVVLHLLNVNLLFLLLKRITGETWKSAAATALYAIHPLRVESVAWVTERKDVLSTFFGLLSLWCYVSHARQPKKLAYVLSLLCLACGLMVKQMLVTIPCVMLLLDHWPLNRARPRNVACDASEINPTRLPWSHLIIEKIPFFAMAMIFCIVAIWAQMGGGATIPLRHISLTMRLENAVVSYTAYLWQTIWPVGLAAFYPHPLDAIPPWQIVASTAILLGISGVAAWKRVAQPWLFVGWFWFVGTLFPVIGLVQVGSQRMADRFTYVPHIGLMIAICWTLPALFPSRASRRVALPFLTCVALMICLALSWRQTAYWRDTISLMKHTLDVAGPSFVAHNNLGMEYLEQQRASAAVEQFRLSLEVKPDDPLTYSNLGLALASQGRLEEAIDAYRKALKINPNLPHALTNLGNALCDVGRPEEGAKYLVRALRDDPDNAVLLSNLGMAYINLGQPQKGMETLKLALSHDPEFIPAHYNLGYALLQEQRPEEAIEHFQVVLKSHPEHAESHYRLGLAFLSLGNRQRAIAHLQEAIRLQPAMVEAREKLSEASSGVQE